jgi:hypothetical protein
MRDALLLTAALWSCAGGDFHDDAVHVVDLRAMCNRGAISVIVELENGGYDAVVWDLDVHEIWDLPNATSRDDATFVRYCTAGSYSPALPKSLEPHEGFAVTAQMDCDEVDNLGPPAGARNGRICIPDGSFRLGSEQCTPIPPACR